MWLRYLICSGVFGLLLVGMPQVFAQEMVEGWPIEQSCIEIVEPPDGWTYEGTIFTLGMDDHVRGMRADLETTYIVAYGGRNFTTAGTISPDGRWFAVPAGDTGGYASNMMSDRWYTVDRLRVYSTDLVQKMYEVPWEQSNYRGSTVWASIPSVNWLNNVTVLYAVDDHWRIYIPSIVHPFTGEIQPLNDRDENVFWWGFSPDVTRVFTQDIAHNPILQNFADDQLITVVPELIDIAWKPDSSGFAAQLENENSPDQLILYDRNGQMVDILTENEAWSYNSNIWSWDGRYLLFATYGENRERIIQLADSQEKIIIDTCIRKSNWYTPSAWFEDNTHFATTTVIDDKSIVVIVDLNDHIAYNMNMEAQEVLGWRPE